MCPYRVDGLLTEVNKLTSWDYFFSLLGEDQEEDIAYLEGMLGLQKTTTFSNLVTGNYIIPS